MFLCTVVASTEFMQQRLARSERDREKPEPHSPHSHTVPLPQRWQHRRIEMERAKEGCRDIYGLQQSREAFRASSQSQFTSKVWKAKGKTVCFHKEPNTLNHSKINLFAFCSSLSVFKQVFKVLLHVWVSVIRNCHHTPSLAERNPKWDSVINVPSSIKGLGIILINVYHTLIAPRAWFAGVSAFIYCPAPVMPNGFADWRVMKGARYTQQDLAYITLHRSSCSHRTIISFWFLISHFTMCSCDCELRLCKTGNLEFWPIITALSSSFPCSFFTSKEKQLFFISCLFNKRS